MSGPEENTETRDTTDPVQLHLVLPYKFQPREHPRVRSYLDRGFRIVQFQRISDREAVLTLQSH